MPRFVLIACSLALSCCAVGVQATAGQAESIHSVLQRSGGPEAAYPGTRVYYEEWTDASRGRTIPVKIYMPDKLSQQLPVIVFSHGLGGSREAATYLCSYWAQHQYICVAIQHPGSDSSFWQPKVEANPGMTRAELMGEFRQTVADPRHAINRVYDVHFVIDELERRNRAKGVLQGRMNLGEIAIAGHSFGAWTALAASGQQSGAGRASGFQSVDPRVKAAIYLSPPASKNGDPRQIYGGISVPGFTFTGTRDDSPVRDTKAAERRIPYDNMSRSDEYLVILNGADHMLFGGRPRATKQPEDEKQQELVQIESTGFLNAYLKHDEKALRWLEDGGASQLIGNAGTFESKQPR